VQDSDYQRWYDEAAHPLRKHRPTLGLEAAWTAVLGGPSAGSLMQQQLPSTLLEASSTMPWDAAAASALRLLRLLLNMCGTAEQVEVQQQQPQLQPQQKQEQLQLAGVLLRAFDQRWRKEGAKAAAGSLLGLSGELRPAGAVLLTGTPPAVRLGAHQPAGTCPIHYLLAGTNQLHAAMRLAQQAPAGGALVLLSAQLLGLMRGERALAALPAFGGPLCEAHPGEAVDGHAMPTPFECSEQARPETGVDCSLRSVFRSCQSVISSLLSSWLPIPCCCQSGTQAATGRAPAAGSPRRSCWTRTPPC
jgi:hypothetical protein